MNARDTTTSAVERSLQNTTTMMTVPELCKATGMNEQAIRAELKALAGQGQVEHIPGRGRYGGRYGLIAAQPHADATAQEPAVAVELEIPAPQCDPDAVGFDPVRRATAEGLRADAAEKERMTLLNVIADIRAAIGDNTGKIMLGDLAESIAELCVLGDMHRRDVLAWEHEMEKALDVGSPAMAVERILLLRGERDETVRQYAILKERHDSYEHAIAEIHRACSDAGIPEGHVATRAHKLAETVTTLRQTAHVLADNTPVDVADAAAGYLIRVPKRRPRTLTKPEAARSAALSAARTAGRADVFALVPVGSAVRGAQWREA